MIDAIGIREIQDGLKIAGLLHLQVTAFGSVVVRRRLKFSF